MAAVYSARFSRCTATRPGLGFASAAASVSDPIAAVIALYVGMAGGGRPEGGISCGRSLVAPFPHASPEPATCAASNVSRITPAVFSRLLWQVMQYLLRTS